MSSNLRAEPRDRLKLELGTDLKFILRKRYGEPIDLDISADELPYLQGLLDAGNESIRSNVEALIKMIKQYNWIKLKEEY